MKDYVVFSISNNKKLAKDFSKMWNCPLGKVSTKKSADGEVLIYTETDVVGKDVLIIESTAKRPNDSAMEILMLLESVKKRGAKTITLIIPYLGYSRIGKLDEMVDPIPAEIMAKVIETGYYDKLMVFDIHNSRVERYFSRGVKNILATGVFANYYRNYFKEKGINLRDVAIVSPNVGSNIRADHLIYQLRGCKKILIEQKIENKENTGSSVVKTILNGDAQDKICIIIDDIISTGSTIASTAKLLYKNGAKSVLVAVSHGVFAKGSMEVLKKAKIDDIAVTNTIEQTLPEGVKCLDILQLIMQNI